MVRREENKIEPFKQLVSLLSDGAFHSESTLSKTLGLAQRAISKIIQQFSAWDIPVESVKSATGPGYRIPNGLSLLDKNKIQPYLSKPLLIETWDSLPSTNDYLMEQPSSSLGLGPRCCLAERQTQGKGRRGRHWISPFARNIYLSLLWHFPHDLNELSSVSLITSIGIVRALRAFGISEGLGLKWPNDTLWNYKKLAGALIELSSEPEQSSSAVFGIGLNVNMPSAPGQKITQSWTDLGEITGQSLLDRNKIAGLLLNEIIQSLTVFQEKGFAPFMDTWQSLDLTFGKSVSIMTPTQILKGIGRGITDKGYILLELETGEIKSFSSGEISVCL